MCEGDDGGPVVREDNKSCTQEKKCFFFANFLRVFWNDLVKSNHDVTLTELFFMKVIALCL